MLKRDEAAILNSCWNKAREDEMLFVLLGRDLAFGFAIREWCEKRIELSLNSKDDSQIAEAKARVASVLVEQASKWNALDVRRLELAERKSAGTLTEAESLELWSIQKILFDYLNLKTRWLKQGG